MNAPIIWVIAPLALGAGLAAFSRHEKWTIVAGASAAAVLAVSGWFLPIGEPVMLGRTAFRLEPVWTVLGRQLVLSNEILPVLAAAYATAFLWFCGAYLTRPGRFFVSQGLTAVGLLSAAATVHPWTFSGIFILLAIVVLIPLLAPPNRTPASGVIRFLSFQVIGVPFLLMASSMLNGLESTPVGLAVVTRPAILLGLGFIFLLGLFPFHAWIPRLFEDTHPYAAAFVLVFLPAFFVIIGLNVIDRHLWLRESEGVFRMIRSVGLLTALVGGLWTAFQRHLGRILGYSALVETGIFLMAVGAGPKIGSGLFFPLLAARSLSFLLWALGLAILKEEKRSLWFRDLKGSGRVFPIPTLAVVLGMLSSAGFPLLIGFVPRLRLSVELAPIAPSAALAVWIGSAGVLAGSVRSLAALVGPSPEPADADTSADSPSATGAPIAGGSILRKAGLLVVCALILAAGILPAWVQPIAEIFPKAFGRLLP